MLKINFNSRLILIYNFLIRSSYIRHTQVYASDDWNERLDFTISGLNIGSVGNVTGNPTINITISDPDNEIASNISIWYGVPGSNTSPTVLTSSTNTNTLTYTHNTTLNSSYYYYVKVSQADGDLLWSAPIWATKTSVVVAIELLSFKAEVQEKEKSVIVSWDAEQTGAANYLVERSIDGYTFETIGKVTGHVNRGAYHYQFTDLNPVNGYSYYRLKQIDADGTWKYSNIASVYFRPLWLKLKSLSPNPASDVVSIAFDSEKSSNDLSYFIYNEIGNAVLYQKIQVREGENIETIDISKLPAGIYFLNVGKRDNRMIQTRFMKF